MHLKIQFDFLDHWIGFEVGVGAGAASLDEVEEPGEIKGNTKQDFKVGFQAPDTEPD